MMSSMRAMVSSMTPPAPRASRTMTRRLGSSANTAPKTSPRRDSQKRMTFAMSPLRIVARPCRHTRFAMTARTRSSTTPRSAARMPGLLSK